MKEPQYQTILPKGWQRARGYAYGVSTVGGRTVRVAGQVAVDAGRGPVEAGLDMGQQFAKALANLVAVVQEAGGAPEHIVMLRTYVTSVDAFHRAGDAVAAAWRSQLGKHFPAMTLVEVSRLYDESALVEIEGEAVVP